MNEHLHDFYFILLVLVEIETWSITCHSHLHISAGLPGRDGPTYSPKSTGQVLNLASSSPRPVALSRLNNPIYPTILL